jgi:hypothetical protein
LLVTGTTTIAEALPGTNREASMRNPTSPPPRDFDSWLTLARSDPRAFEDCRDRIINDAILRAPRHKQLRLRRMQWKLDQIRNTSRTPMIACLRMNRMLWESVIGDNGLLHRLIQPDVSRRRATAMDQPTAVVIPFKQRCQKPVGLR